MRPKQGIVVLPVNNALLNLTLGREYAGPQNRSRLRPLREAGIAAIRRKFE
jgi:hypothetical protein